MAIAASASGCRDERPEPIADTGPRRGGVAIVGSIADADSWNEYTSRQTFAHDLLRRMYLRLAEPEAESAEGPAGFRPSLAQSFSASEDGRALTFRLREAQWSDGAPVTAADVRFTWRAQTAPEVAWTGVATKRHVRDVEVVDARTVTFHLDRAYPEAFRDVVEGGILPEHAFGAVPFSEWRTRDWSDVRAASGPFLLERHRPGDEIVLVRNPGYLDPQRPYLDRVVVRIVPDAGNLLTQFLSGAIDYLEGIAPRDAARVQSSAGATLLPFDEPKYDYLGWNGAKQPFADPSVRRALTLAIDREALVETLLYGFGRVSRGPILSFSWGADPSIEPWPYDPEQARRLLADAGFAPRAEDGALARNGRPLAFEITTNAGNRLRESALVVIQEQLGRIGIRAEVRPLEMKTFVERNVAGRYDAYLGGWRFTGKIDLESIFGSGGANNVVRYRSARVDALLGALDRAAAAREALAALHAIQREIHQDLPYTFLYEARRLAAAGPRLRGVAIELPSDPLRGLERWWIGSAGGNRS